jgi:DNA-binding CsgD family transcriptional regulator
MRRDVAEVGQQHLQPYERGEPWPLVTPREHQVLRLLADDKTMAAIALTLGLSAWTIRHHVRQMRVRSDTHTSHGLVAWGFRRRLVT